ncbi:hypothetical protein [Streptomyces phaeochromogenes]
MGWMQFVVAMKWPFLIVVLLIGMAWWLPKESRGKSIATWVHRMIEGRDVNVTLGALSVSATAALESRIADAVAPVRGELNVTAPFGEAGTEEPPEPDTQMRRDSVEEIIRSSATWGWEMSHLGLKFPPNPKIEWGDDGRPKILFNMRPEKKPGR